VTLSDKQWAFLKDLGHLINYVALHKPAWKLTGGELHRSEEQAELYYARGIGIINSNHRIRLAIDLNLFIDGEYQTQSQSYKEIGEYWESLSPQNRWGGNFSNPDGTHFERVP